MHEAVIAVIPILILHAAIAPAAGPPPDEVPPVPPAVEASAQPEEPVKPPEPEKPPPQFVVVEGQVTDHVGAGQEEVKVTIHRKTEDGQPGELLAEVQTDELGDFVVKTPEPVRGDFIVTFSKPQHANLVRELHLDGDEEFPPFLAETLQGNLALKGRVTSALDDKAVAGASVKLSVFYRNWNATTDAQGRFVLEGLSPGPADLVVEADGYGREQQRMDQVEDAGEVVVQVKPERILHLEIVDDLGRPIPRVTVETLDEAHQDFRTTVTDEAGAVTLHGVHFDAELLTARLTHPDHASSEGFDREIVPPPGETESTHRLVMPRAGSIAGTVTDRQTGKPLYGARLMTGAAYSDVSPRDWSDYGGRYTISGVRPGSVTVTAHMSGYAPNLATAAVRANEVSALDIQLGPAATVQGVVKNDQGKPVAGAYVETAKWRGHTTLGLRAITDHDGRFVIENAPHDEFEITVWSRHRDTITQMVPAGERKNIQITLPAASPAGPPPGLAALKVGDPAPEVAMITLAGEPLNLARLKGKTVVLDFWATWCGPCIVELPDLLAVYEKFGKRSDFLMIGVSLDWDEKAAREFVKKYNTVWPQVFGDAGGAQKVADRFGVIGIPMVIVVGPDGKIAATELHGAEIRKGVEKIMKDRELP